MMRCRKQMVQFEDQEALTAGVLPYWGKALLIPGFASNPNSWIRTVGYRHDEMKRLED